MGVILDRSSGSLVVVETDTGLIDFPCDASVNIGDPIIITGGTAFQCIPNSESNANFIGVVISKTSSILCDVMFSGHATRRIYSGLVEGDQYFVAKTGGITNTPYDLDNDTGWIISPVGIALSDERLVIIKGELKVI